MYSQTKSEQIINNNDYCLQVTCLESTLTLKLSIKVSQTRTDIYQVILNQLKDVDRLEQIFQNMQDFKQYIKDISHIDIVLENKTIRILAITEVKNVKKYIQITSVPLNFVRTIEKDEGDKIIQEILDRCSLRKELDEEQIRKLFLNVALYLSQNKKQNKLIKQQQNDQIKNLKNQIESHWFQSQENNKKQEQDYRREVKDLKQKMEEIENKMDIKIKQLNMESQKKSRKIQKQLDRLEDEKFNRSQVGEMKVQTEKINKELGLIQNKMDRDINALGMRLEIVEKLLAKLDSSKRQSEGKIMEKMDSLNIKNWVDDEGHFFKQMILKGSTITAKSKIQVFRKRKVIGQYTFTAIFSKIRSIVGVGVNDTLNKSEDWKNKNFAVYWSNSECNIAGQGKKIGSGFRKGDRVRVTIDLNEGTIQWRVGSEIRHQQMLPMLKDSSITWVPYIYMTYKDDSVEISEE